MKKIAIISAALLLGLTACKEPMEELIDPAYSQLFSPTEVSVAVSNITNATVTWGEVTNATGYMLELYKDKTFAEAAVQTNEVEETLFAYTGLDEDVEYAVRIQAVSDKIPASKWTVVTFATVPPPPPEITEWNFSDTAFNEIPTGTLAAGSSYTVNGLDVATGTSTMTFATGTATADEYTFTRWVQTGGAGSLTSRYLHLKVPKSGVLTVWTQSNGDAGRICRVVDAAGSTLAEVATTASSASPISLNVNVEANTDLYIYSTSGGIRIYAVILTVGGVSIPLDATTDLKALAVTGETLSPAFDPEVTAYEVTVPKSAAEVEITFDKGHPGQTVAGAGKQAFTAKDSVEFPVKVTSEDSVSERTYTIKVKRNQTASADADLKTLSVSAGTLLPAFSASATSYTLAVGNSVGSITVTGTANHKFATVGNIGKEFLLQVGDNEIPIVVLAEDLSVKTYTITVTRADISADATLKALTVSGDGLLVPAFSPTVYSYTDTVLNEVSSVTVTGTANHEAATVSDPVTVDLQDGDNTPATITVTAEDGTTQTYTVKVVRKAEGETITEPEPPVSVIKEWNFSSSTFTSALSSYVGSKSIVSELPSIDGMTFVGSSNYQLTYNTIESESSADGNYTFTYRVATEGGGNITDPRRTLKFDVTGNCKITVYHRSNSNSEARAFALNDGTSVISNPSSVVSTEQIAQTEISYTGDAKTLFLYSTNSSVNFYLVKVEY
ncbi:MAG: cadherin-like beta sandwich domain-containing protein [Prevotellaceae bacterium]|jgi:VCBS repeat-containing protein|nr:cadherin-like beta sandwich domain-containing protein [Prevotellaceae bacterium]